MKAVSVPSEERIFKQFYIPCGFFAFFENICLKFYGLPNEEFHLFEQRFFFLTTGSSASLLEIIHKIFFVTFLQAEKIPWWKQCKVFCFALNIPGSSIWSPMMSAEPLCCRSSPPLWLSHQPQPVSVHKTACMQPSSRMMCVRSWPWPYSITTYLPAISNRQLYYLLASTQWETRATSSWDQRRKWMSQFWISQKCRGKKPAPSEREGGKEWVKPESSGVLPKPLEACDRSLFYLPPEK